MATNGEKREARKEKREANEPHWPGAAQEDGARGRGKGRLAAATLESASGHRSE